jgi:hypothetical protein
VVGARGVPDDVIAVDRRNGRGGGKLASSRRMPFSWAAISGLALTSHMGPKRCWDNDGRSLPCAYIGRGFRVRALVCVEITKPSSAHAVENTIPPTTDLVDRAA